MRSQAFIASDLAQYSAHDRNIIVLSFVVCDSYGFKSAASSRGAASVAVEFVCICLSDCLHESLRGFIYELCIAKCINCMNTGLYLSFFIYKICK